VIRALSLGECDEHKRRSNMDDRTFLLCLLPRRDRKGQAVGTDRRYFAISPTTTRLGGLTITILSASLANL
jgi:hypothetical protein